MLNGDDGLGHVIDFVAWSDACDEIPVQPVGCCKAAFKGGAYRSSLHGVRDVNVGNFHAARTCSLDSDGDVNHAVSVFGDVVVKGVHQGGCCLDHCAYGRIVGGDDRGLIEEDIGFPVIGTIASNVQHGTVRITFLILENKPINRRCSPIVGGRHEESVAKRVSCGIGGKTGFLIVVGVQPRAAVIVGDHHLQGCACWHVCRPLGADLSNLGAGVEVWSSPISGGLVGGGVFHVNPPRDSGGADELGFPNEFLSRIIEMNGGLGVNFFPVGAVVGRDPIVNPVANGRRRPIGLDVCRENVFT